LRKFAQLRTCAQFAARLARAQCVRAPRGAGEGLRRRPKGSKKIFRRIPLTDRFQHDLRKTAQLCADALERAAASIELDATRIASEKHSASASIFCLRRTHRRCVSEPRLLFADMKNSVDVSPTGTRDDDAPRIRRIARFHERVRLNNAPAIAPRPPLRPSSTPRRRFGRHLAERTWTRELHRSGQAEASGGSHDLSTRMCR